MWTALSTAAGISRYFLSRFLTGRRSARISTHNCSPANERHHASPGNYSRPSRIKHSQLSPIRHFTAPTVASPVLETPQKDRMRLDTHWWRTTHGLPASDRLSWNKQTMVGQRTPTCNNLVDGSWKMCIIWENLKQIIFRCLGNWRLSREEPINRLYKIVTEKPHNHGKPRCKVLPPRYS